MDTDARRSLPWFLSVLLSFIFFARREDFPRTHAVSEVCGGVWLRLCRAAFICVDLWPFILSQLLTRAAQKRDSGFAGPYRAATVRERASPGLFQQPATACAS